MHVQIGVDVGETNTDAVVVHRKTLLAAVKCTTTPDITSGIIEAINKVLAEAHKNEPHLKVTRVHIGTTHFYNAVVQRAGLVKVGVLRLCRPASLELPPFSDFLNAEDLREKIDGRGFLLSGGYQPDGQCKLSEPNQGEITCAVQQLKEEDVSHVVVNSIYSPINSNHEKMASYIISERFPEFSITLAHHVGHIGLLERENGAILNESLKTLCHDTIEEIRNSLDTMGLKCPIYLSQNDGTILSAEHTSEMPVHTFACGPANSMRGGAFLTKIQDAIVVDMGGTTTVAGFLDNGFPREASAEVEVGGVRTNFRMPDVTSIALGGGSIVKPKDNQVEVGPESVGNRLEEEAYVFGGSTLTATDIAVAEGLSDLGDASKVAHLDPDMVSEAVDTYHTMLEDLIDSIKISDDDVPVILVGGGSILIDTTRTLKGVSEILRPTYFEVANAVGAALDQVSGNVDKVITFDGTTQDEVIAQTIKQAEQDAINTNTLKKSEAYIPMISLGGGGILIDTKRKLKVSSSQTSSNVDNVDNVDKAMEDEAIARATIQAEQDAIKAGANPKTLKVVEESSTLYADLQYMTKVKVVGDLLVKKGSSATEAVQPMKQNAISIIYAYQDQPQDHGAATQKNIEQSGKHSDQQAKFSKGYDPGSQYEPVVDPVTGEWLLSEYDVECISVGTGIFGCGGGGNPHVGKLKALKALRDGKVIRVITPERLSKRMTEEDFVAPVAIMGAPVIITEKLTGQETVIALQNLVKIVQSEEKLKHPEANPRLVAVHALEVGGVNSVEPLMAAVELGLPVIDCDGMGRAFPELQAYAPVMYGTACYPGCVADAYGNTSAVLTATTPNIVESLLRDACIRYGQLAGLAWTVLKKDDFSDRVVHYSLSRAFLLGKAILDARRLKADPVQTILDHEGGKFLFDGKVANVTRETEGGFNTGKIEIKGLGEFDKQTLLIDVYNENLVATLLTGENKKVLACTPDLITVVIPETGAGVSTGEVSPGLRVSVIGLPSHPLLNTDKALEFVGPQSFGVKFPGVDYVPLGKYIEYDPIPLK